MQLENMENEDQTCFFGYPTSFTQSHVHSELRICHIAERRAASAFVLQALFVSPVFTCRLCRMSQNQKKWFSTAFAAFFGLWCWLSKQHFTQSGLKVRGGFFCSCVFVCEYARVGVHNQNIAKPWKWHSNWACIDFVKFSPPWFDPKTSELQIGSVHGIWVLLN